jgi:hypothetical protein
MGVSGNEAKLEFLGYALMENCHGLIVDATLTQAASTYRIDDMS